MLSHFKVFEETASDPSWATAVSAAVTMANTLHAGYSSSTGILPDFVQEVILHRIIMQLRAMVRITIGMLIELRLR